MTPKGALTIYQLPNQYAGPYALIAGPDGAVWFTESYDRKIGRITTDGQIKEFDSLTDTTPTIVTNLSTEVDDYWDRGLLGMALDPNFPSTPYMYVLESYDAAIGGTAPRWNDNCPSPPCPKSTIQPFR